MTDNNTKGMTKIVDDQVDPAILEPYIAELMDDIFETFEHKIAVAHQYHRPEIELTDRHMRIILTMLAHSIFCRSIAETKDADLLSHQFIKETMEAGSCMSQQAIHLAMQVAEKGQRGKLLFEGGTVAVAPETLAEQEARDELLGSVRGLIGDVVASARKDPTKH